MPPPADPTPWHFWIDVGGTFTDCIARAPDGTLRTHKLLSTGRYPTRPQPGTTPTLWTDPALSPAPVAYFTGYTLRCKFPGQDWVERVVAVHDSSGCLHLSAPLPAAPPADTLAELVSHEEAPVAGIRWLLGLPLAATIGPIHVRLGTTRATNALLERRGARTALVTTAGFADALRIGYQDRPHLFDLHIPQPPELYETTITLLERLAADGSILQPLDESAARTQLTALRAAGIESLAVCLLHSYLNPVHEQRVGEITAELGFGHVSLSHRVSPLPKLVYRGDSTVLDAYLTPVLRDYCRRLAAQLPGADLRFMTSAGSLVALDDFSGKDAILSGPAGGVVGFARVTDRAGLAPAFAFDMGGTSTDVSRWDGQAFTRRYETEAGRSNGVRRMRLQTSMLEIETVAAGGGSICGFDGEKFVVGPHSAGADPGPACYGRGGPLTVTDLNFYLGRLPRFPFPLDLAAVERRLDELLALVNPASFSTHPRPATHHPQLPFSRSSLATGFLRIADAAMVAPIRQLAAARGDDPRAHTLVAFGGAGGQHACAVARELGMSRILCSPHAGVLSALGIGLAPVALFVERALTPADDPAAVFVALETELRPRFAPGAVFAPPRRTLEMRYRGQETRLPIAEPPDGDFPAAFAREHQRLFNFAFPGRPVENYAARVELSTVATAFAVSELASLSHQPSPAFLQQTLFDNEWLATNIYERTSLAAGMRIAGPAIVLEPVGTVVIEPGWSAEVTVHDDLLLTAVPATAATPANKNAHSPEFPADPVELELFHHRFASVAGQMGVILRRTALSTNVKERLDFSCALFDATGSLVANAAHIPVHLGAMQECVRCLRADVPDLRPGEVYVTNDPFRGGSHLPDVTVITPVFTPASPLPAFFTASRAHHAEIGGITPGSLPPTARTLAEEGVLIRAFRYDTADPAASDAALRNLLWSGPFPTRAVDENLADLHAQIAANQTGASLLAELVARHGLPTVAAYTGHLQRAAGNRMRAALARQPAGTRRFRDTMDDGTPIVLTLTTRADGTATFDFTGSGPVHPGNLNANPAIVASAVIYCLRCLLNEPVPLNAGLLAPVEIVIPPGTLLHPVGDPDPRRSPAVGGGNVETSQRLVDVILGAFGLVAASQGTMNNLVFGRGGPAAFGYYETIGGGSGAGPAGPGASAVHVHMTNTRLTDPEVLETRYPVRLRAWSVRQGSGGAGRHRGGDGMVRELEFLAPLSVSLLTNRRLTAPYGLAGGGPGQPGRNLLRRSGESTFTDLPPAGTVEVRPGDILRLETPGGGGWGTDVDLANPSTNALNSTP